MPHVAIVGAGKIGIAVKTLLQKQPNVYSVVVCDNKKPDVINLDVADQNKLRKFIRGNDVVVSCLPYNLTYHVAYAASVENIAYFDLTEDIGVSKLIKKTLLANTNSHPIRMPHCGLAPGVVCIIANELAKQFDNVKSIEIRVGALPKATNNQMKYYLSWSPEGVINEYCNPCEVIYDGVNVTAMALEGLEEIVIDGSYYEAFNTSGGLGTMCSTWKGKVRDLNYKTIRYLGHRNHMQLILNDFGLRDNKELLAEIFRQNVPYTTDDIVIIYISCSGEIDGKVCRKTYIKKITGRSGLSAIELTTASGVCGVIEIYLRGSFTKAGFIKQEDCSFTDLKSTSFGGIF